LKLLGQAFFIEARKWGGNYGDQYNNAYWRAGQ
jgi:hypothetical protein